MKISSAIAFSAVFLATLAAAAPHTEGKIDQCVKPGQVALTFDDGPGIYNDQLLALLKKKNVPATFFLLGSMIDQDAGQAASLKKMLDAGHQLASHTYSHQNLDAMTPAQMQKEMTSTAETMFKHAGVRPAYMRAPEGSCAEACTKVMTDLGLVISHWNVDTNDWRHATEKDPQVAVTKSMAEINKFIINGSNPAVDSFVVLEHEIHKFSVDFLAEKVIDAIHQKGYKFVTMEECVGKPSYLPGSNVPNKPSASATGSAAVSGSGAQTKPTGTETASKDVNNHNAAGMTQVAAWAGALTALVGYALL